ncbi:MAG: DNA polymerase III subunit beta, partial [Thermaurantiacus sp.]
MKLVVERATLLKALGHVQSVVERRNTIPILSNVLISAEGEAMMLMATDLDLQVVESAPADVTTSGATTVSAHTLYDIVRKLPDGSQATLETQDLKMTVTAGRARFQLQTLPREDFPVIGESDLPVSFQLPSETLRELIDKTRFAISTEETRYYLNGIFLHATSGDEPRLRAVATDGHRLARVELPLPEGADGMPDVIVPRKCVAEVRKLLDERDGPVTISLSQSRIRFEVGAAVLTSKLIDGTFPDYSRVIPTANDRLLRIDPASLAECVDRVTAIASEKTRAVKLSLDKDRVTLSVVSPENGMASEDVPADYDAPGFDVGFNSRYLLDI